MRRYDGQPLPKLSTSVIIFRRLFSHLYFADCFYYRRMFYIPTSHRPSQYFETPDLWWELERIRLLRVSTLSVFAYYPGYILRHFSRQYLVWHIATSQFIVNSFILFFGLLYTGGNSSFSGDSGMLPIRNRILLLLPSRICGHIERYIVFELLRNSDFDIFDMILGFLVFSLSREVDCSRFDSP